MVEYKKIGIIDSGISREFLRSETFNIEEASIFQVDWNENTLLSKTYNKGEIFDWITGTTELPIYDPTGHGTAVSSILHRKVKTPVKYYVAKILDEHLSGSSISLLAATHWLADQVEVDFLNMSLGTNNFKIAEKMNVITQKAKARGCEIFSAAGGTQTLPSELKSVTAVGTSHYNYGLEWVKVDEICEDSSVEFFKENTWVSEEICTSFACPVMLSRKLNTI